MARKTSKKPGTKPASRAVVSRTTSRSGRTPGAAKRASPGKKAEPATRTRAKTGTKTRRDQSPDLRRQLRAVRAIGAALSRTVGLDALLREIVPHVSRLMGAERTTLFLFDAETDEIWSKVAEGETDHEIRLPVGRGVAGWVAAHRKRLSIPDAYADSRFQPDVDAKTGFRTRSIAAVPLVNRPGELLGVLQVLNKRRGQFAAADLELLQAIGLQASYAVENAHLAQQLIDQNRELEAARNRAERRRAELNLLYQLEQETSASADLGELLDSIIARVAQRMRSEAGSVLLTDQETGCLYFRGVSGDAKETLKRMILEPGEGLVGWVAQTGEGVIVNTPADDPRHDTTLAAKIDFPATALLAVPLIWDEQIIGAMEVLNPRPRTTGAVGYDVDDLKVLTLSAGQVARAVALTRQHQARRDTDRLALIGRMLAGVAHDLRNPMAAISGYAQLMAIDGDGEGRQRLCQRVLTQIDEMTGMVGDLLAFARGETGLKPAAADLAWLAKEVESSIRPLCEPRRIHLDVSQDGGTVRVDVGRARRIIDNLARNAVEALTEGGHLQIEMYERDGGLSLCVRDDGPGLPEEVRNHLFEPFVTSDKQEGTGLGLSIVKRFVDDHGGRVEIGTAADRGTTFVIELPPAGADNAAKEDQ